MNIELKIPEKFLSAEDKVLRVETKTKQLWAVELDLLAQLDKVCAKHDIKYFAISGTLIGAARHQGFIPWDDDIDVVMLRSEYDRFLSVGAAEFTYPYFLQTNTSDPGSFRGHAQLRNSETTGILKSEMKGGLPIYTFNQGVFLDVFPLDNIPDAWDERSEYCRQLGVLIQRARETRGNLRVFRQGIRAVRSLSLMRQYIKGCVAALIGLFKCCNLADLQLAKFEKALKRYENTSCSECASLVLSQPPRKHEVFKLSDFKRAKRLPFEFLTIPVPFDYESVLSSQFGDWRKHVIGANSHGGVFVDLQHSYKKYLPGEFLSDGRSDKD